MLSDRIGRHGKKPGAGFKRKPCQHPHPTARFEDGRRGPGTPPNAIMHVCILGCGIVGLAAAYALHRQGASVTLIDQADHVGAGASTGNGAQLSYSYVQPLADPAIWRQLPKLFLQADSPLRFQLQADPRQWAWGLRFLAACRTGRSQQTTRSLLALATQSRSGYEAMLQHTGIACDHAAPGKLVLYPSAAGLASASRQVQLQADLGGAPQQVLGVPEVLAIEPSLAAYAPHFAGAIHTPSECVVDSLMLCQGLARWLGERGVRILLSTRVERLLASEGMVRAALTGQDAIEADHFVVSTGWRSPELVRNLGVALPVYPLKGYSITVDLDAMAGATADTGAPVVSVTDTSRKVVFARIGRRLRVAGMVELVGANQRIDPARIDSLRQSTQALFPALAPALQGDCAAWSGMRPATPTGVPITQRAPSHRNLWLNTGHGALGVTLAFGSAQQLGHALLGH